MTPNRDADGQQRGVSDSEDAHTRSDDGRRSSGPGHDTHEHRFRIESREVAPSPYLRSLSDGNLIQRAMPICLEFLPVELDFFGRSCPGDLYSEIIGSFTEVGVARDEYELVVIDELGSG
jgi:hypothetical protein